MKITKEQQRKGNELMQTLVQKAWESAEFKEQLLTNPEAAIEIATGIAPKGKNIVVEDQTDDSVIYINIPQRINLEELELTEEQLEMVSGGFIVSCLILIGCAAAGYGLCALLD
jgi:hypothetical protein